MKTLAIIALTLGSLTTFAASARDAASTDRNLHGYAVSAPALKGRVIDVSAGRPINVTCGELVTFVNGSQSFTWKFEGRHTAVELAKLAPAGFQTSGKTIYIARDLSELG